MMDATATNQRRRDDSMLFRVLDRFGLPTLMVLMLFYAWNGALKEERARTAAQQDRLASAFDRLALSLDANTAAAMSQREELHQVAERVRQLEELGARAMAARTTLRSSPTPAKDHP